MLVYWTIFGFAAAMCLLDRGRPQDLRQRKGKGATFAIVLFAALYIAIGGLRYRIGGDWEPYSRIFTQISYSSFGNALSYNDPLFALLNWVSAQLGTDVYLPNAVVCAILVTGVIRIAGPLRDRWLAILIAVPYILIVIGLGYVRQAAAIGFVLLALHAFGRTRRWRAMAFLAFAIGFHSTAIVMMPLFIASLSRRFAIYAILLTALATYAYFGLLEPRLEAFQSGYLDTAYASDGALVRLLMSAVPALLLLARWRHLQAAGPVRTFWLLTAIGALALLAAYFVVPSSTAVDRIGLYFSIVQIFAFGELTNLFNFKERDAAYVRLVAIALAAAIQVVWLVYATNAVFWVPYTSVLSAA